MSRYVLPFLAALSCTASPRGRALPVADHHQHLFSPAIVALLDTSGAMPPLTAGDLIPLLDSAGIRKATVLSVAYMYGSPKRTIADEYAKVRAENDWTAEQASQYPDRLVALCGVNPLEDYALDELARCAKYPRPSRGIKLHFGNSDVQLDNPVHAERMRRFFQAANDHRMAIVVHMRASISMKRPYGAAQARVFLEQLLPAAPDVAVQVAHLASSGPGFDDPPAHEVIAVLAEAVQKGDPRTKRLLFDVASNVARDSSAADEARIVKLIRQVGVERILYGTDAAVGDNPRPGEGWTLFRRLPLTDEEFEKIAGNVAPYLE
jgi:predicted TIM-barrel fold metal-dependent hydrolase